MSDVERVSFEDFTKLDIRIGEIIKAEKIPNTDKLLKLSVDVGLKPCQKQGSPDHLHDTGDEEEKRDIRQIISGIAEFFPDPSALIGRRCPFIVNLEPRIIRGFESDGMIVAVDTGSGISLLLPESNTPIGSKVR